MQFGFKRNFSIPDVKRMSISIYLIMVACYGGFHLYQLHRLNVESFDEQGRRYLSETAEISYSQTWGRPRRDTNVTEGTISIYGQTFAK
ncbi:MAG: hypothetical protein E4H27_08960 [Anaerolineales bacterium]|nr:MAG: hypothetical protein E4H27_08960 [Anaerolineales bacterium]